MSMLRRPPTSIRLTAEEVRHTLEQAAQVEDERRKENQEPHQQAGASSMNDNASAGAQGPSGKVARGRNRDERIGVGTGSSAAGGAGGAGRITEHVRNAPR